MAGMNDMDTIMFNMGTSLLPLPSSLLVSLSPSSLLSFLPACSCLLGKRKSFRKAVCSFLSDQGKSCHSKVHFKLCLKIVFRVMLCFQAVCITNICKIEPLLGKNVLKIKSVSISIKYFKNNEDWPLDNIQVTVISVLFSISVSSYYLC